MSDLSHWHCKKCRQPDYACECEDADLVELALASIMRSEVPPEDHPFFDHRPNLFKKE
jgi:hypothetical protein